MHFHGIPTFLLPLIATLIITHVPNSSCSDYRYSNCSQTFQCGNVPNIGYPFWGLNRPDYCGWPEFELSCSGDAPELTILSQKFRVLNIINSSYTLNLTRADYWGTYCPSDGEFANTTIDTSFFTYTSNTQSLFLYYKCQTLEITVASQIFGLNLQFSCVVDDKNTTGYYVTRNISSTGVGALLGSCETNVNVPVYQENAQVLENNLTTSHLLEALDGGFGLKWDANNSLCEVCVSSGGLCGYNSSTQKFTCYCKDQPYLGSCGSTQPNTLSGRSSNMKKKIVIGVSVIFAGIVIFLVFLIHMIKRRRNKETVTNENIEEFMRNYATIFPQRYSYSDIKKMTNSFAEKLGHGGFGCVYKGKLSDDRVVAVKVLSGFKGNGEDFLNEIAAISRTSHVNIVCLLGFCYESSKRALVYEFIANGSLDKFIYDKGSSESNRNLEWETLHKIAVGIARGLAYLHQGCNTRILHFNIKPHNILLDETFCPKISDFGLAKLSDKAESKISIDGARGTVGYIAPEVALRSFGAVSHKSDVYSYGMMVLEMVGGRKNLDVGVSRTSEMYFPHFIYKCIDSQENSRLFGVENEKDGEISKKMILVSLWCIQTNPADRPCMSKVVELLEGSLESLLVPPKPFLCSPTRFSGHSTQMLS